VNCIIYVFTLLTERSISTGFKNPSAAYELHVRVVIIMIRAASMKITTFWGIAPCYLVEVDRRLVGVYCLHHQGDSPDDGGTEHVCLLLRDYSGRKITESLGNVTVRGQKYGKSKGERDGQQSL
jgi:hypothetical protein